MNYECAITRLQELWAYPRLQHQLQTIDTLTHSRTPDLLALTLLPLLTRFELGAIPRALIALGSSFLCIFGMCPELYQHLLPFFPVLTSCALSFPPCNCHMALLFLAHISECHFSLHISCLYLGCYLPQQLLFSNPYLVLRLFRCRCCPMSLRSVDLRDVKTSTLHVVSPCGR